MKNHFYVEYLKNIEKIKVKNNILKEIEKLRICK